MSKVHNEIRFEGRYPVRFRDCADFLDRLSPGDRAAFQRIVTNTDQKGMGFDRRSFVQKLENPIEQGGISKALRLKGIAPKLNGDWHALLLGFARCCEERGDEKGIKNFRGKALEVKRRGLHFVMGHTGEGFVNRVICAGREGLLEVRTVDPEDAPAPEGSMSAKRLHAEIDTALLLGSEMTDPLLGWGTYEGLEYHAAEIGFAVYGIDTENDTRFSAFLSNLEPPTRDVRMDAEARNLSEGIGKTLRFLHDRFGRIHRYPHFGNWRVRQTAGISMVDLDTALSCAGMTSQERMAWRFVDLWRGAEIFYSCLPGPAGDISFGGHPKNLVHVWPLLASFLIGYFHLESRSELFQYARRYLEDFQLSMPAQDSWPFGNPADSWERDCVESFKHPLSDYPFTVLDLLRENPTRGTGLPPKVDFFGYLKRSGPISRMFASALKLSEPV